jgi:hypothetical protein
MAPKTTLNPPTFRYPFESEIAGLPPGAQNAHRAAFQGIQDLQQAVTALNTKVGSSSSTTSGTTTINETSFSQTVIAASTVIGKVNNQSGVTTYTTLQSDYGAFIIFDDTSPIAVTLSTLSTSPAISLPWYTSIINSGTGTVTLTPASGLIEGGATFQLHANNAITVVFDGTNFYVEAPGAQPQNTPQVPHEWLNSFSSTTGTFGQSQPAFTDISGTVSPSQLPFPTSTTLGGVESAGPVTNEWIYEITTAGVPLLSQPSASNLTNGTTGTGAVVLAASPTFSGTPVTPALNVTDSTSGTLKVGTTLTAGGGNNVVLTLNSPNGAAMLFGYNGTGGGAIDTAGEGDGLRFYSVTGAIGSETYTIITSVSSTGLELNVAQTASTATAGGASALPSDPQGYLEISINGTMQKIPYYNV